MIVRPPPLEMSKQLWSLLGSGPGTSCERCHAMTDGQVYPFNKGSIQPSREAHPLQGSLESGLGPQAHHVGHPNQLASPVTFLHLAVDQARRHLPSAHIAPATTQREPLAKVGRESREVEI